MCEELLGKALAEGGANFRKKWSQMVEQRSYTFDVAQFSPEVRGRHLELWEQLLKALETNQYTAYLVLVEREGRLQARASSRIEALVSQLSAIMNLLWEVISTTPSIETNPALLRPLTEKLNILRSRAESAILKGFLDESRLIQEEQASESVRNRQERLQRTTIQDLVKTIPAFRIVHYQEKSLIFQPGDSRAVLYFVMVGRVRLYEILPDGRAITLSILGVNDVCAQSQNQDNYFHDVYAEAMEDSVVACIKEKAMETLMEASPLLASRIIYSFSQQLSQSQVLIEGLLGRDVALRLVTTLLKLAKEFGQTRSENTVVINRALTHQELADMLGSNRVTVTRKMLELQKKKLITVEKGTISIVNKKALEAMVA